MSVGYARTWISVRLPERALGEILLEVASPLLVVAGAVSTIEQQRVAIALVVSFWNATVRASKHRQRRRVKELNELKKQLREQKLGGSSIFDVLAERCKPHWLDPRLVTDWTYDEDEAGTRRLACTFGLPEGVRAEVAPPIDKRISIGGVFLDEVRIRLTGNSYLNFPYTRHNGSITEDGTATVQAMMPTALQLFAVGRLQHVGGPPVDLNIGGRALGPMQLVEVRSSGSSYDVATLVFKPAAS